MVDQETINRVAAAIDCADFGYSMRQIRLVDDVNTYRLAIDGMPAEEFTDNEEGGATEQAYARIREVKQRKQAEAVIAAMSRAPEVSLVGTDWLEVAKLAGEHGVRYQTNARMKRFLVALGVNVEGLK